MNDCINIYDNTSSSALLKGEIENVLFSFGPVVHLQNCILKGLSESANSNVVADLELTDNFRRSLLKRTAAELKQPRGVKSFPQGAKSLREESRMINDKSSLRSETNSR